MDNVFFHPLDPGSYHFCISAIYDLTSYGYSGGGASQWTCMDTIEVVWGSVIPYFENWDSGSFEGWRIDGNQDNWLINTEEGEPAPSAQFSWNPILTNDYSSTLTTEPIIVDSLTEGEIYVDFDLKLVDRNSTENEKLRVEVYNGNSWNQVAEFANNGKSGFTTNHIDITEYTTGNTISIRFNVTGQNSSDIESWFLDNISVTRQCSSPQNVTGEYIWNDIDDMGIELCWEVPDTVSKNYGSFNNGEVTQDFTTESRDIDGFNIYRKEIDTGNYILYDVVDLQPGQTSYCYFDAYPNVSPQIGYYYQVSANYSSDMDICESLPAAALEIPEDDFVYVFVTGFENVTDKEYFSVFPNPTHNMLNIVSSNTIKSLTLINNIGQIAYYNNNVDDSDFKLNTNTYKEGVYFIKVETETEISIQKVIIK